MPHAVRFTASVPGRRVRGAGLALLALATLAGCLDEPESITAPRTPGAMNTSSSGTWAPGLDPAVRNPPMIVSAGRTYRIWYLLENTAPHTRSFWVAPWEPTGNLEFPTQTREYYGFAPGEKRWIWYDFTVKSGAADGTELDFYFGAVDLAGEQHGRTQHILRIRIANTLPVVAVEGGEHHVSAAGRPDTISVWIYNPRPTPLNVCFRWLEDEGYTLGDIPQFLYGDRLGVGEPRCKPLPPQTGFDTVYVYTYGSWNTRPRQTLQVWNQNNGAEIVHAFRKTTVVSTPPRTNRFYALTQNYTGTLVGPGSPLPLFAFGGRPEHHVDRNYVSTSYHGSPCALHLDPTWADFARRNPGETYVIYEEPGQPKAGCQMPPSVYADAYRGMVNMIKGVDPSARIATAYFEQENPVAGPHFVRYADQFWADYSSRFGHKPPIAEWNWIIYAEPGACCVPQPGTLAEWKTEVDTAVSYSLGLSVNRFPGQQKPVGAGVAPMGIGIGFPHQPNVPDWDAWMTGMVDYIDNGAIYDPVRGTQSYRDGIVAAYWWVLERWDPDPNQPGDCSTTHECNYRLSDDGVNLNTYGQRYRTLTQ